MIRETLRDLVVGAVCTIGLVIMVLGHPLFGLPVLAVGVYQIVVIARRNEHGVVDQRADDREGKPRM